MAASSRFGKLLPINLPKVIFHVRGKFASHDAKTWLTAIDAFVFDASIIVPVEQHTERVERGH